ncbi:MAG: SBBP repeat-containing protein, partial [Cyanobacteriota bacterium]
REDGALIIKTETGELIDSAPYVYQEINGEIKEVESAYKLLGDGTVGFSLGAYDSAHTLVIDPVLIYYQQVPGVLSDDGYRLTIGSRSNAIAVDSAGNLYITGSTSSIAFPAVNAYQATAPASSNAFVTKFDASGQTVLYSTYLGGSFSDYGRDIAVDSAGNAYILGNTISTDFPTVNPLQPAIAGSFELNVNGADAFVAKLNATGNALLYSTYLGGSSEDEGKSIALDGAGNIYVMGSTTSSDFPTLNPLQSQIAGDRDGFVSKLNPSGTALIYSTYFGSSSFADMAVDNAGHVFVTGTTNSANFPTQNALQGQMAGRGDGFVSKLNVDGTALVYSTYLGGSDYEVISGIAVDSSGNAYVRGSTNSNNFPLKNALAIEETTTPTAFVSKLNAGGTLAYSTYLASSSLPYDDGSRFDYRQENYPSDDIAVDNLGNVYTRITESYFSSTTGGRSDYSSLFKINPLGNSYTLSRSNDPRQINDIAVDNVGGVYIILNTFGRGRYYAASDDTIAKYYTGNPLFTFAELLELEGQGKEPATLYFDEKYYLANNPDVAADVAKGNYA